jgi:hypothetical protein
MRWNAHEDFQFLKSWVLSVAIDHHWQQSQVPGRSDSSCCDRSRPMVADGSGTVLTQSFVPVAQGYRLDSRRLTCPLTRSTIHLALLARRPRRPCAAVATLNAGLSARPEV